MRSTAGIIVSIPRNEHTILVVDDNEAKRYITTRILDKAGFKTMQASSGQDALLMAKSNISAIILDVHLPDIDGFQVCKRLRENLQTEHLPIIHLSAIRIEDTDKIEGLNSGADGYLVYPVEPAMLVASVQALIRARMAELLHYRSEQKFRAIYNHAQSGIALIDVEGKFREVNPALLKMLKYKITEVIDHPISEFAASESKKLIEEITITTAVTKNLWHEEFALIDAHGKTVYFEWSMSPYVENDLRVAVITNISERIYLAKQKNALLEREKAARQAAEQLNRMQNDFIAIISHELRNPLSSIVLNAQVLSRMNLPEDASKCVDAIYRGSKTQTTILSDLLDASQINSGKLHLELQTVEPISLIKSSLDAMKIFVEQKSIQVVLDIKNFRSQTLIIDPARFQQIFWNIFNNAIKFSSPGGKILISLSSSKKSMKLKIRDFGKGIEADFLHKIFDKFSQSERPGSRARGSLGLGLYLVKSLVSLQDGTINIKSDGRDKGTLVEVEFPIKSQFTSKSTIYEPEEIKLSFSEPIKILLVEDDNDIAIRLSLILEENGAKVTIASDYSTAMKLFFEIKPDILISDIGLPFNDGYELIRNIRQIESTNFRTPAIALTAFNRDIDRNTALEAGFNMHLSKPVQPYLLLKFVHELLS